MHDQVVRWYPLGQVKLQHPAHTLHFAKEQQGEFWQSANAGWAASKTPATAAIATMPPRESSRSAPRRGVRGGGMAKGGCVGGDSVVSSETVIKHLSRTCRFLRKGGL
jgi:hypothetical protein